MNDPFQERLRALRPGKLPAPLAERLAAPPAVTAKHRIIRRLVFAAAAAACVALVLNRAPEAAGAGSKAIPVMAGTESSHVTDVRPLAVITDDANRSWQLMEVNWVEENTFVSAGKPLAVQFSDHYATVIPVAIQFD